MYGYRNVTIDIMKGIGMLCVMLGHIGVGGRFGVSLIYLFHMPLFFLLSGYFFRTRTVAEQLKKDANALLRPWLIYASILSLAFFIVHIISGEGMRSSLSFVVTNLNPFNEESRCLYYAIWFLPCLFFVRGVYCFFNIFCSKCFHSPFIVLGVVVSFGYCVSWYLGSHDVNIPFFVDSAVSMLLFYYIGHMLSASSASSINRIMSNTPLLLKVILFFFISIVYTVIAYNVTQTIDIKYNIFPIWLVFVAIIGVSIVWAISCFVEKRVFAVSRPLSFIGEHSILFLGLHRPLLLFIAPVVGKLELPWLFQTITILFLITALISLVPGVKKRIMTYHESNKLDNTVF